MQYKWTAFSVTSIGSFMAAVDGTIILLALLPVAQDLSAGYVTIIWVVIAYLLASTALVLSFGRISDLFGRKRMYNVGFAIFTLGSALCALSPTGLSLVAFRVVQGVGAALLTANSFAILSEAFPPGERGKAFGSIAIVWAFGSIVGILLGGVIISVTSWRVIFLINIPIGIFGTLWAYRALRESKAAASAEETFDIPAAVLFTLALTSLLVGVTWGLLYGWTDPTTLIAFILVIPLFAGFTLWEMRYSRDPIIDFDFFRERIFTYAIVSALLQSLATFSVNFMLIFYLEGIYGLSVLTAAYLILPNAIAVGIVGPIGGRLSDRFGARAIASVGLCLQVVVLLGLSQLEAGTPLWLFAALEALFGVGGGLFWPANTSTIMSSSPRGRFGVGSGIMNTFRSTGMVLSFAVSLIAVTATLPASLANELFIGTLSRSFTPAEAAQYLSGQSLAFLISTALLALALVLTVSSRAKAARQSHGAARLPAPPPKIERG